MELDIFDTAWRIQEEIRKIKSALLNIKHLRNDNTIEVNGAHVHKLLSHKEINQVVDWFQNILETKLEKLESDFEKI